MTEPSVEPAPGAVKASATILPQEGALARKRIVKALAWLSLLLLLLPPFVFGDDAFRLSLFAKYLALAVVALGVDLIWGYTGLLSLGQGLYFSLGAYALAYCLELQQAAVETNAPPGTVTPGFMNHTNLPTTHPDYHPPAALSVIAPLANAWTALAVAVVVPFVLAMLFGLVTFRLRIRGVYFALITQVLLLAVFTLVDNQQPYTGGRVGIKNLADLRLFNFTFNAYRSHVRELYWLVAGVLAVCFIACAALVRTKLGRILTAIRDNENRVLALGYNTAMYKVFIFAFAGALAGISGALYVAANQLCGPGYLDVGFSIEMVIFVAVGGRGTLFGALLGTLLVNFAKTRISEAYPNAWTIILGLLFIGVVLFMPAGIVGSLRKLVARIQRGPAPRPAV